MDTSEQYIKMCDCPEIWNQWALPPRDDDLYAYPVSTHPDLTVYAHHTRRLTPEEADTVVWLPRQDQIQKMVGLPVSAWGLFYGWVFEKNENAREPWQDFPTGEQIWLAFYMQEKYSKIWDGEKWDAGSLKKIT